MKYILKNSVQEHYLFMEEGGAKDINLLMKLFENNIQDHDLSFKQHLRCHHDINSNQLSIKTYDQLTTIIN